MRTATAVNPTTVSERRAAAARAALRELVVLGVIVALGTLLLRGLLVEVFWIPSASMEPTLVRKDYVLVLKPARIDRGDVIVFKPPVGVAGSTTDEHWIKRAVGLPGDVVQITDGIVTVNGDAMNEPYARRSHADLAPTTVGAGRVFFMGDNRTASYDSSVHGRTVPVTDIVGEATSVVWPLNHFVAGLAEHQP